MSALNTTMHLTRKVSRNCCASLSAASQAAGFRFFPTCADRNGCEGDYSIHINSHKMEVVTIAVDKSTILEIRKTIALLFQSSLTALVGAIIKAKGIY